MTGTRPAMRSMSAGPPPLYGMCTSSTPARMFRSSPARCCVDAIPEEEKLSSRGFALAAAISSFMLRAVKAGCTSQTLGESASCETGAKSRIGSKPTRA